jgi:hypothetical protein
MPVTVKRDTENMQGEMQMLQEEEEDKKQETCER